MKPRYAELADQLIQAIGDGTFEVGSALPSELDLSAQYGVSRATVRSALERVQDLGLISRRKRAGIRVEATKPRVAFDQSLLRKVGVPSGDDIAHQIVTKRLNAVFIG